MKINIPFRKEHQRFSYLFINNCGDYTNTNLVVRTKRGRKQGKDEMKAVRLMGSGQDHGTTYSSRNGKGNPETIKATSTFLFH